MASRRPLPYILRAWQGVLIGLSLAVGFTLFAFELRGSWDREADPVVPMMVPFLALGGMAIGVVWERGGNLVWVGVLLFAEAIFFVLSRVPPMSEMDHGQYAMGVPMTLMLIALCAVPFFQLLAIESRDPRKTAGKA
jgi:hypothetical protein